MGLFNFDKGGAFADVIRCDEKEYLVWKWRPSGDANSTQRENEIRWGSKLRVKQGELAVFAHRKEGKLVYDHIHGPYDAALQTANLPLLSNILGAAFGGNSPFQAEIYFINLACNIQVKFGIPYFDMFDPRFPDLSVPCAIRGSLIFNLEDFKRFITMYQLVNFDVEDLKRQIKDFFIRKVKSVVHNIPNETGLPLLQLEKRIDEISDYVRNRVEEELDEDYAINLKRLDISALEFDKSSRHYVQLKFNTADQQSKTLKAQTDVNIINLEELARIRRKEEELMVEERHLFTHQLDTQADILKTAAENMGSMSGMDLSSGAGMFTGMMLGGAMGSSMGNIMGNINQPSSPPPLIQYHISINGQQSGPFTLDQLKIMVKEGKFTTEHFVWRTGLKEWLSAGSFTEISQAFGNASPPPPPPPPAGDTQE